MGCGVGQALSPPLPIFAFRIIICVRRSYAFTKKLSSESGALCSFTVRSRSVITNPLALFCIVFMKSSSQMPS